MNCSNPINPQYPNENLIFVGNQAVYIQPGDPDHSISATTTQLFGVESTDVWPPPMVFKYFVFAKKKSLVPKANVSEYSIRLRKKKSFWHTKKKQTNHIFSSFLVLTEENGFVYDYAPIDTIANDSGSFIMQCFDPSAVPIITTLANEFGVIDRWYADVPGPTDPNRLYSWMATSSGMGYNADDRLTAGYFFVFPFFSVHLNFFFFCLSFISITFFFFFTTKKWPKMLDESVTFTNQTWRVYFEQSPSPIYVEYTRHHPTRFKQMADFYVDVSRGDLPIFTKKKKMTICNSWLDPAYDDLHPDHDVTNGEKLMKRVYESLRQSPIWEDTLLLIFYDEHGGFFDHVPPPWAVSPDGRAATDVSPPFNFTRYGIRIPAIVVSPYVKKGTVANRPDPSATSQYSHSSLPHTIRAQFAPDYPPFTNRDDVALTFEDMLNLDYPRGDCPTQLPDVPPGYERHSSSLPRQGLQPVNDFQLNLAYSIAPLCHATSQVVKGLSQNQDTLGRFAMECADYFIHN
ncbi:Phosphoesterase family protein [Reticulomyxa filosa]|uniref:Phosphoesterase family protein n=1 Tax=Reticulomyxa filosa TaxID=46433 RepID=X6LRN5_RETFI|nr:Phosphoesterase family protein [Reticulomyxa filosa]|eukprot:ETO04294.1 Phosphoesterase family protein [Reticulomyxa filosa]